MQDLYAPSYPHQQPHRHQWPRHSDHSYPHINTNAPLYPQQPSANAHSSSSNDSPTDDTGSTLKVHEQQQPPPQKSESKPQATFLTKLYASVLPPPLPPPPLLTRLSTACSSDQKTIT